MNDPKLLLLDEPTAYLDPEIAWQVKNALLDAQREKGTTILAHVAQHGRGRADV